MIVIGCPDELVIGYVKMIADVFDLAGNVVNICFRFDSFCFRFLLNLLTVLIGSGLEENFVTLLALKARDAVRENNLIGIADMRNTRRICNRGSDVIGFLVCQ